MKHSWEFRRPLFTSCCPGWVRFLKFEYPDMVPQLSTAKSPQQMFGAVTKTWFAKTHNIDPKDIFCVSVMPCVAKKYECAVPEINSSGFRDVDAVLTTREVDRPLRLKWINVADLPEEEFDSPLGEGMGAAVIFGATGGVMEAALRTAYAVEGHNPDPAFQASPRHRRAQEISPRRSRAGARVWRVALRMPAPLWRTSRRACAVRLRGDHGLSAAAAAAVSRSRKEWSLPASAVKRSTRSTGTTRCASRTKTPPSRRPMTISSISPFRTEPTSCSTPTRQSGASAKLFYCPFRLL